MMGVATKWAMIGPPFLLLLWTSSSIAHAEDLKFECRIFEDAPIGTLATAHPQFKRFLDSHTTCVPSIAADSPDRDVFTWDYKRQMLASQSRITIPKGRWYTLSIQFFCENGDVMRYPVEVKVGERSQMTPVFSQKEYKFYVHNQRQKHWVLGKIESVDRDPIIYNSMIAYYLVNDTLEMLDITDKEVSLRRPISFLYTKNFSAKFYTVQVSACDYGSPQRCGKAIIVLQIVDLTEPQNVEILAATPGFLVVCWMLPEKGRPYNYDLLIGQNLPDCTPTNTTIERSADDTGKQCYVKFANFVLGTQLDIQLFARDSKECVPAVTKTVTIETAKSCPGECNNKGVPVCVARDEWAVEQLLWDNKQYCTCASAYNGNMCQYPKQCVADITHTKFGKIAWSDTDVYTSAISLCPYGSASGDKHMTRFCNYNDTTEETFWDEPNITESTCYDKVLLYDKLNYLYTTASKIDDSPDKLNDVISELSKHWYATYTDARAARTSLDIIDSVSNLDSEQHSKEYETAAKQLRNLLEQLVDNVVMPPGDNDLTVKSLNTQGIALQIKDFEPAKLNNLTNVTTLKIDDRVQVDLSRSLIEQTIQWKQNQPVRFHATFFESAKLFPSEYENSNPVVDFGFSNFMKDVSTFDPPINFSIRVKKPSKYKRKTANNKPPVPTCVYWNEAIKDWDTHGVRMLRYTKDVVQCETVHTTGFSILFDFAIGEKIDFQHEQTMNILSWVGCGFSMTGLLLTMLTYGIFRCLNRDHSGKILLNLCTAMFLMNLAFVLSSLKPYASYPNGCCIFIGVLLHYATLSSLLWMAIEAANMYRMVVHVFATTEKFFMLKRCLFGWGLPFIVVVTTVSINTNHYNNTSEVEDHRYCQISTKNGLAYYMSYLGPACILLLTNCVVFAIVLRALIRASTHKIASNQKTRKQNNIAAHFRGAFSVMILLGITWVFGAFAVGPARLPFKYAFCLFNSLQGFIIFLVRCLFHEEARQAWLHLVKTGKIKKHRGKVAGYSESSSSASYRRFQATESVHRTKISRAPPTQTANTPPTVDTKLALLVENTILDDEPITPDTKITSLLSVANMKFIDDPPTPSPLALAAGRPSFCRT